jgi:hypothetical protein
MFLIPELAIERWLFYDGLSVNDGRLVALAPAVEEATGIRDRLLEELAASQACSGAASSNPTLHHPQHSHPRSG